MNNVDHAPCAAPPPIRAGHLAGGLGGGAATGAGGRLTSARPALRGPRRPGCTRADRCIAGTRRATRPRARRVRRPPCGPARCSRRRRTGMRVPGVHGVVLARPGAFAWRIGVCRRATATGRVGTEARGTAIAQVPVWTGLTRAAAPRVTHRAASSRPESPSCPPPHGGIAPFVPESGASPCLLPSHPFPVSPRLPP